MSLTFPAPRGDNEGRVILEFRAGRCKWDGKVVSPDPRLGKFLLIKDSNGISRARWKDIKKNEIEVDVPVFEKAYLYMIPECKTGRVIALKTIDGNMIPYGLFWMQEPEKDKDEKLIQDFNTHTNCSPSKASSSPSSSSSSPSSSSAASSSATSSSAAGRISSSSLSSALSSALAAASSGRNLSHPGLDLSKFQVSLLSGKSVLNSPMVSLQSALKGKLISLKDDSECMKELVSMMPEGYQNVEDVIEALHCPQLGSSLSSLNHAIFTDLPTLLASMGLKNSVIDPNKDPLEAFGEALEKAYRKKDDENDAQMS